MNVIRKDAAIVNTGSDDDFPGTFEVVLSTPALDRDGDELASEDWKQPLPEHITFDTDHGMSVASTVGSGAPRIEKDGRLIVSGTYSSLDRAQECRTLVKEGHIRTTSVAFMSEKSTKDGKTRTTRELLNGAFVAIPSNREALVLNSKALDLSTELTASAPTDPSEIGQLVTRLLIANGIRTKGFRADTKAVAGSYEQRQQALSDAIDSRYPGDDMYAWTLATFDYSVVYRVGGSSDLRGQWQCDYTYADDGTVELGEPTRVTMVEQVVPAAAAKSLTQDQDDQTDPAAADEPVTPAADEPAAEVTDEPAAAESDVDLQLRAFALSILAQSAD